MYDFIANDPCEDKYRWFCLPCKAINKNQKWIMQSTSNFRKHLRSYHQDLYSESDPKQSKIRNVFTKSDKSSGDSQIKRRSLWTDFTLADKQHADSKLTDWIANHSQSFSVVEHEDFREFSAALRCDYQVPCRSTIKNRIIAR